MNRYYLHFIREGWLFLCFGLLLFFSPVEAAEYERPGRPYGQTDTDPRREQMKQQAQEQFSQVDAVLTELLETAGVNQRPSADLIDRAQSVLEETKRYAPVLDDDQKGRFMLLQSWTGFFQGNQPTAVNWSMRACKTDEASQDAWISQALFSMLNGKRPLLPRLESPESARPRRSTYSRQRNTDLMNQQVQAKPYSQKGVLEFDLMGLRGDFFREQFGRLTFVTTDQKKVEFVPGTNTLCILFCQDLLGGADANEPAAVPTQTVDPMMEMEYGMTPEVSQETPVQQQRDYFRMLMDACGDHTDIKFVQMDTSNPGNQQVSLPSFDSEQIPTVIAADPSSNAQQFVGLQAKKVFMAIIDKEGKVKYAGTAEDFVPAFILTELTGIPIDLEKRQQTPEMMQMQPGQPNRNPEFDRMFMSDPMMESVPQAPVPLRDPNKPVMDPNVPAASSARSQAASKSSPPQDFPTQSIEDDVRAQKLLQSAQMHIEESRKLHMKNPQQGIEDARQVLKEFPNTEYAQQARELLRRVPDRWKERYNITDEELGY